jgi:hypothetical protein
MVNCIRLCLDWTSVCTATLGVVSRQTAYDLTIAKSLLVACVATCQSCGDECARHAAHHEHCRVCEQACRRCEQACRELLDALKYETGFYLAEV